MKISPEDVIKEVEHAVRILDSYNMITNLTVEKAREILEKLKPFFIKAYENGLVGSQISGIPTTCRIRIRWETDPRTKEKRYDVEYIYSTSALSNYNIMKTLPPSVGPLALMSMVKFALRQATYILNNVKRNLKDMNLYNDLKRILAKTIPAEFSDIKKLLEIEKLEKDIKDVLSQRKKIQEAIVKLAEWINKYKDVLGDILPRSDDNTLYLCKRTRSGGRKNICISFNAESKTVEIIRETSWTTKYYDVITAPPDVMSKALDNLMELAKDIEELVRGIQAYLSEEVELTKSVYEKVETALKVIDDIVESLANARAKELVHEVARKEIEKLREENKELKRKIKELEKQLRKEKEKKEVKHEVKVEVKPSKITPTVRIKLYRKMKTKARYKVYGVKTAGIENPLDYKVVIGGEAYNLRTDGKDYAISIPIEKAKFTNVLARVDHQNKLIIVE